MCWDVSLAPGSSKPTYITFDIQQLGNGGATVAETLVTAAESRCTQVQIDPGRYFVRVYVSEPGVWHLTVKPS